MATQVQFRRGTTSQNNAFTGAQGELTIDTQVYTIRIHDGTTAGGKTVPTLTATQTMTNKTMGSSSVWNGNVIGLTYGGTGAALTAAAGAVVYSTSSGLGLSLAGTSGQVLTSGGTSGPTWVNASSLSTGTATTATLATNIAGGSAGYLMYQTDTNTTGFIAPGDSGFVLRSTGASTAPAWVSSTVTLGTTATQVGDTSTSIAGVRSITMGNGSHGGATVASVTGTGPWTATLTGISLTTGIMVGQNITATAGTGTLYGGSPTSVLVASIVSGTSITVTVTGGTIPTTGTITSLTTFGFLQVPSGTTAQRPWVPANGMIRYNSTQSSFEGYASSAWSSLGGVKSVDGYTYIQAETSAGNSNGDLDFYAENAGGDAASQVGQWNRTNLKDYTGTLVGTQTTQNVFNATATTINFGQGATTLSMGSSSGTSYINNATISLPNATAITAGQTTVALLNTTATTVNAFGAATALNLGAATGTTTVGNRLKLSRANSTADGTGQILLDGATGNRIDWNDAGTAAPAFTTRSVGTKLTLYPSVSASAVDYAIGINSATLWNSVPQADAAMYFKWYGGETEVASLSGTGNLILTGDLQVKGGDITTDQTTFNLLNATATTLNIGGAATTMTIGSGATGATTTMAKNVVIVGNLTVQGTTTTEASSALTVSDSAVYLNDGATDNTKDIGIIGTYTATGTKYTGVVKDATDSVWKFFSAPTNAPTAGSVVDFTGATYDSIKVTGVNKVTVTEPASAVTLTLASGSTFQTAGSVSHAGAYSQTFTATANTSVTLPTTGTLATLAGAETLTNKTIAAGSNTISGLTNSNLSGSAAITNANLANSTISGISLGSNLATLTIGTGLTGTSYNGSTGVTIALGTSGVSASTYGSATQIPVFAVDTYGRVTSVTNTTLQGGQYFGSAATKAIAYNSNSIAENITITSGNNGLTSGPITIANGYTVTVADGAAWTIV